MNQYQAIIIGFGKAGKTLAATLAKTGWRVAIIEQSNTMYGGTCINIGCIPTKTLVHDAELQHDFAAAMQRKADVFPDRQPRQKAMLLKHHAALPAGCIQRLAIQLDAAGIVPVQAANQA